MKSGTSVSFVTHQLRTPLAASEWLRSLGRAQGPTCRDRPVLRGGDAREANKRLIRLVNDLLNVSRLESGKIEMTPSRPTSGELTASVVADLQAWSGTRAITSPSRPTPCPLLRWTVSS